MATEELIIQAKWHDQGFSVGAKRAQRDLAVVNRNASAFNATLGALGATASQVKAASDAAVFSLGLVAEQLRHIESAAESALDGLRQMAFGIQNFNDAQTAGLSAAAAAIGGIIGTLVGGVGFIKSVVDSFVFDANENFDPTRIIETIRDPGEIIEGLREFWEELQSSDLENLARYEQLTRRERRVLSQLMTRFEISLLQQETAVIIAAIEHRRATILNEINNAEEAQRAALKRAIRLDFDFAEAELRARYQPLFAGAGGDQAQLTLLRESAGRDIDALRRDEAATLTDALHELSNHFQIERTVVNSLFGGLIAAMNKVSEDLSNAFDNAQRTPITCSGTVDVNVDVSVDVPDSFPSAIGPSEELIDLVTGGIKGEINLPDPFPMIKFAGITDPATKENYQIKFAGILDEKTGEPFAIGPSQTLIDLVTGGIKGEINLPDPFPMIKFAGITDPATKENYQIKFAGILDEQGNPITIKADLPDPFPKIEFAGILDEQGNPFAIGPSQTLIDLVTGGIKGGSTGRIQVKILEKILYETIAIRYNTATLISTIEVAVNNVLNSPDIYGQSFHNRSVRLLLRSINYQLGGADIVPVLEDAYRSANEGSHKDENKYKFAADPPIVFSEVQEGATPTSLFGYKTFQTDIETIRKQITTSDTTLKQISTTIPKTEHIEGKLDSVVTELKNLEKPSYTIGDIHIHVERIDEESAEEIATEIRDRIITEFGENTELRNVRYTYAGTEALT